MTVASSPLYNGTEPILNTVGVRYVAGSFALSGATTAATVKGEGFAVKTVSSGTYTIDLDKTFASVIAAVATFQGNTATDRFCSIGAISGKTIQIRSWDKSGGAVANIATDGTERVEFLFVLGK